MPRDWTNITNQEIPQEVKEKKFKPSDIKWLKTVNDDEPTSPNFHRAYLRMDDRVWINPDDQNDIRFCLQANGEYGIADTLNKAEFGDIILLY